jgi:hypothetical protein
MREKDVSTPASNETKRDTFGLAKTRAAAAALRPERGHALQGVTCADHVKRPVGDPRRRRRPGRAHQRRRGLPIRTSGGGGRRPDRRRYFAQYADFGELRAGLSTSPSASPSAKRTKCGARPVFRVLGPLVAMPSQTRRKSRLVRTAPGFRRSIAHCGRPLGSIEPSGIGKRPDFDGL